MYFFLQKNKNKKNYKKKTTAKIWLIVIYSFLYLYFIIYILRYSQIGKEFIAFT